MNIVLRPAVTMTAAFSQQLVYPSTNTTNPR